MSKTSLKVFVAGSTGRVGKELLALCTEGAGFELGGQANSSTGVPAEIAADVVVDFSSPQFFDSMLSASLKAKKPFVSGTTGLSPAQFEALKAASAQIPICWASNMSVGVAFVKGLLRSFSALDGFDFQIEEIHHRHKKDAPSGTAITLQAALKSALSKEQADRLPEPLSLRGGGVFGVHKIWAFSEEEVISLEHQALNRRVFAKGALIAAQWLVNQKPGLYSIDDVLRGA